MHDLTDLKYRKIIEIPIFSDLHYWSMSRLYHNFGKKKERRNKHFHFFIVRPFCRAGRRTGPALGAPLSGPQPQPLIFLSNLKQINLVKKQDNLLSKLLIQRSWVIYF
jgi:hypothetical protein